MRQFLRLMDQEKVTAVFQRRCCCGKEVGRGAAVLSPGQGCAQSGGAAGKLGGIGYAAVKSSGKNLRKQPQVGAYAFHTGIQTVAPDVIQSSAMGIRIQFQTGDGTVFPPGAEQKSQRSAAGAQIQNPGSFRQPDEVGKDHGIGA